MTSFSEESRISRRIRVGTALLTGAAVLVVAIVILVPRGEPPPEPRKPRRALTSAEEKAVAGEIYRATPPAAAPTLDEAKLARAMDDSVARTLVRNLMEAAASENQALKASMIGALGRQRAVARPILEGELARAENATVRGALEEALARCK